MKVRIFAIILFVAIIMGVCICYFLGGSGNGKLIFNEIVAYFCPTVYLNYNPNVSNISEIQIGGTVSMSYYDCMEYGNFIYTKENNIKMITNYLNTLLLVESTEDELPNNSPDAFIQYFDDKGNLIKNFIIYGQVFIRDVNNDKLYRIKKTKIGIIEGLEKLEFNNI